jgi:hypothetical protein
MTKYTPIAAGERANRGENVPGRKSIDGELCTSVLFSGTLDGYEVATEVFWILKTERQ